MPLTWICAYIDPGSGSLLFQLLIGGLMAVLFYFRRVRSFIVQGFRRLFSRHTLPPDAPHDDRTP